MERLLFADVVGHIGPASALIVVTEVMVER
jgi:hypothetical protein